MSPKVGDKKEAIYLAAIKLLNENGFQSTPMSAIAKEAKVAAGTIYLYFENKEDMLNKLYLEIKEKYRNSLMTGYSRNNPGKDSFEVVWRNSLEFMLQRAAEFNVMEQFRNSPFVRKGTVEEGLKIFSPVLELFERARKEKAVKNISLQTFLALFFGPVSELVKTHQLSKKEFTEDERKIAFQATWDSIKS